MRSMTAAILGVSLLLVSAPVAFANCATDDPDGSKTLAARQQVATDCTCDHGSPPTVNHGQYVKCAANVANTRSGLDPADPNFLPKTCKGAVSKCAAHSTCGKPGFVTCCITTAKGTKCKTKKDAMHCTDKQGVVGSCDSCCDACPAPGSGPSCPAPTTTTTTVTTMGSTTTSTTLPCTPGTHCGPCGDGSCVVTTEGQPVCIGGPCLIVGCTTSAQCQPGQVCDSATGGCCNPCP